MTVLRMPLETAAAGRVAQPKVGERRKLEHAGFGFLDIAPQKTIKVEPVPGPAQTKRREGRKRNARTAWPSH